jgi:hypothetical protein
MFNYTSLNAFINGIIYNKPKTFGCKCKFNNIIILLLLICIYSVVTLFTSRECITTENVGPDNSGVGMSLRRYRKVHEENHFEKLNNCFSYFSGRPPCFKRPVWDY